MALLYRSKNGSRPHNKPRVFFTCHPQDRDTYLLPICEELFRFCDCTVYYEDPSQPTIWDTDHEAQLKRMNLFVIPVTAAFLNLPNPGLDRDFRFAITNHIPVLPLVQEPGLEKRFAVKCGNIQYLDKTLRSTAAIPYEEKLQHFLNSVLLNDDTRNRIRSHFDGYVFLSYRKKDRRYIRELMQLIHQFPQFRDIALWYDEYLTPGEDFNDEIQTHLNDSKLFALIVTPNLVNEKNYVQEHEYPQALKHHKPVVPIQYESTDGDALRRGYPDIPDCLDPADTDAVEAALERSLAHIVRRGNDADPAHRYHIGLAYLTGTDVEVNHDLALTLITQAAEAGLEEAMEKLTVMYRTGDGVTRDPEQVIRWTQKLVGLAQTRYESSGTHEDAQLYFLELKIAASTCIAIDRYELAEKYVRRQISLAKALRNAGNNDRKPFIDAYEQLSVIYDIQGYENEAAQWLSAACQLRYELCSAQNFCYTKQLYDLIRCCKTLGDLYQNLQNLTDAEHFYRQAIEHTNRLPKSALDFPRRNQLAALYQGLGQVAEIREDYDEAEKQYLAALEIAEAIALESGDDQILISHYQSLGSLGDSRGRLTSGRKYWKQALNIATQRDDRKRTDQTQVDLAGCHLHLGVSYYTNWALRLRNVIRSKSLPHLEQGLAIFRKLDQKQNTYTSRLYVHSALLSLSELHVNMDFFREAEPYCLEQLAISEALLEQMNDPESMLRLAYDLALMTKICKELKKPVTAAKYARRRFELLDAVAEDINTCEIWNDLAEASFDWALLTGNGKKLRYAIEIWNFLAQEHPEIPIYAQREQEAREHLPES